MGAGHKRHHWVTAQSQAKQPLVIDVAPQQRQVGLIVEQPGQRFVGVTGFDFYRDPGVAFAEAGNLRQYMHGGIYGQH